LAYEINFMLKETAQVVSFGTSGLTDEKAEELKKAISDMVEINAQNNSHV
jgi:dihydrodipicolinate reductase